jgi:transposase InsO family protein
MDTRKIAPGLYQYTAIDDCSRYKIIGLYPRRTAENTLKFIDCVVEEMPIATETIQTDCGIEFMAFKVQLRLRELCIKFRPIRPGAPHLNGKVERTQKTDVDEFWSLINVGSDDLEDQLTEWQHCYNWERVHGSIGMPPIDKLCSLIHEAPYWEDVIATYDPSQKHFREREYEADTHNRALKRSE